MTRIPADGAIADHLLLRLALTRAAKIAALLAVPISAAACESEAFQGELAPCRCEVEQCTSASCGYEVRLESGCASQMKAAEILIDGHLEEKALLPGGTVFPCSRTEPGVTSQISVRGGDWIWGPLSEQCMTPGETRLLVLQCVEAAP